MAIQWDFNKDHFGKLLIEQTLDGKKKSFAIDIYSGNCFAIFVYNTEKEYSLYNFFMDKEHAKRMLGLDKKYPATYGTNQMDEGIDRCVTFLLDASNKNARELAKLLTDASWEDPVAIVLCPDMDYVKGEEVK